MIAMIVMVVMVVGEVVVLALTFLNVTKVRGEIDDALITGQSLGQINECVDENNHLNLELLSEIEGAEGSQATAMIFAVVTGLIIVT